MQKKNICDSNADLARKCLCLIRDIADRGASSQNTELVGYALQELSQVLLERTGSEDRVFEPVPAEQIQGLANLHEELEFVDGSLRDFEALLICEQNTIHRPRRDS